MSRTILTEEDIKFILDFWQLNPDHNTFLHPQTYFSYFFANLPESSFVSTTETSSPKHPYYKLPEEWVQEVKAEVSEILATPWPKVVQPKKVQGVDTSFKKFENPLISSETYLNLVDPAPQQQPTLHTNFPFIPISLPFSAQPTSFHFHQVMANPPPSKNQMIVAARYAPLDLPQPLNALPQRYYLKYIAKFIRERDGVTTEKHLVAFYNYVDNQNVKHEDVWTRLFV